MTEWNQQQNLNRSGDPIQQKKDKLEDIKLSLSRD